MQIIVSSSPLRIDVPVKRITPKSPFLRRLERTQADAKAEREAREKATADNRERIAREFWAQSGESRNGVHKEQPRVVQLTEAYAARRNRPKCGHGNFADTCAVRPGADPCALPAKPAKKTKAKGRSK